MKHREVEEAVVEGVLIPIAWNATGEASELGVMTFDEQEYRIETRSAASHGLGDHLRKHVRLVGTIRGERVVRIDRVETLDSHTPTAGRPERRQEDERS